MKEHVFTKTGYGNIWYRGEKVGETEKKFKIHDPFNKAERRVGKLDSFVLKVEDPKVVLEVYNRTYRPFAERIYNLQMEIQNLRDQGMEAAEAAIRELEK